jgi:transglutaminase-like putative cysteine protease
VGGGRHVSTDAFAAPAPPSRRGRRRPRDLDAGRRPVAAAHRRPDAPVDAVAAVALAVLAVAGLHHVFADWSYLAIGAVGAGLGALVVLLLHPARRDPVLLALGVFAAFPLGAGVADGGLVPTPAAVDALWYGLVHAWKDVLTTAPPVGVGNGLGVISYTMGFAAAAVGLVIARRTTSPLAPALTALTALVAGFLLGTADPVSVLAQGAVVIAVILAWGAVRSNRPRRAAGAPHWPRLGSGMAMLAVVAALGLVIGPQLPLVGGPTGVEAGTDRFHVRQLLVPPFDPRDEPSPLAAFRNYLQEGSRDDPLLTVSGLPPDARIRLATMDTYDGVVWVVGGPAGPASGRFERVGEAIIPVPPGLPAEVAVRVERDRPDVWVPTVGSTRSVHFEGERARQLAASFRYNRATRSAALPDRLGAGDAFTLDAQLPFPVDEALARTRAPLGTDQLPPVPPLPETITRRATALTVDATTAYDKAKALASALHDGTSELRTYYSDGGAGSEQTGAASASGHSLARLIRFLDARGGLVGDAEQYAATMALMARWLGLPAQVVLGFRPPAGEGGADGQARPVRGRDVDAWVEVAFDGIGWIPFDPTPPHDRRPDVTPKQTQREVDLSQQEPPPPTYLQIPDSLPELVVRPPEPPRPTESPLEVASGLLGTVLLASSPVWLALAGAALIIGAKAARARRRRRRGPPVKRLAGAWWEVCDRARDLGAPVPLRATRREVARALSGVFPAAPPLAARIDEAMFAAPLPAEDVVAAIWEKLDAEHRKTVSRLGRRSRLRVALSVASLRPRRWQRAPAPPPGGGAGDVPDAAEPQPVM